MNELLAHVTMGVAAGLSLGKLVEIFGAVFLLVKIRIVGLPAGTLGFFAAKFASLSLATAYFSPIAAFPRAIFSVWHNISGALLANWFSSRVEEKAERS